MALSKLIDIVKVFTCVWKPILEKRKLQGTQVKTQRNFISLPRIGTHELYRYKDIFI